LEKSGLQKLACFSVAGARKTEKEETGRIKEKRIFSRKGL
jgi:hypothetical protein